MSASCSSRDLHIFQQLFRDWKSWVLISVKYSLLIVSSCASALFNRNFDCIKALVSNVSKLSITLPNAVVREILNFRKLYEPPPKTYLLTWTYHLNFGRKWETNGKRKEMNSELPGRCCKLEGEGNSWNRCFKGIDGYTVISFLCMHCHLVKKKEQFSDSELWDVRSQYTSLVSVLLLLHDHQQIAIHCNKIQ